MGPTGVTIAGYHLDEPFRRPEVGTVGGARGQERRAATPSGISAMHRWTLSLLAVWVRCAGRRTLCQFGIPGKVHWTEEGHNFSWHMKLRDKDSEGYSGQEQRINPRSYLTRRQVSKMASRLR